MVFSVLSFLRWQHVDVDVAEVAQELDIAPLVAVLVTYNFL